MRKILTDDQFLNVVENTPLVAIDLIFTDNNNRILKGKRINNPAKGKWFVPGGKIRKNESIKDALRRIAKQELNVNISIKNSQPLGVFEHNYRTNFKDKEGISTHYITLAYLIPVLKENDLQFKCNVKHHSELKWFDRNSCDNDVHSNSAIYFKYLPKMRKDQYKILNERRDAFNRLLWRTPVLSLTAQAFLFSIILGDATSSESRIVASVLAFCTAIASAILLNKHRSMEVKHALLLEEYENKKKIAPINRKFITPKGLVSFSSYNIWFSVLIIFAVFALSALIVTILDMTNIINLKILG